MGYEASSPIRADQSPQKVRHLADMIRGKFGRTRRSTSSAISRSAGARLLEKVLRSALANAEDRRASNHLKELIGDRSARRRRGRCPGGCGRGPAAWLRYHQEADVAHPRRIEVGTSSETRHGSESQSDRVSHRRHDRVEEPLVRFEAGICRPAWSRTTRSATFVKKPQRPRRQSRCIRCHLEDRDRANARRGEGGACISARPGVLIGRKGERSRGAAKRRRSGPDRAADQHEHRGRSIVPERRTRRSIAEGFAEQFEEACRVSVG